MSHKTKVADPKILDYENEVKERVHSYSANATLRDSAHQFMVESTGPKYSYNFSWMGRPIIQYPQDIVAMQEIIWKVKPDLIIDFGIAHGGSLILYASILELIGSGQVLGVDIDIRAHNKEAILDHKMSKRISMIEGSSIDPDIHNKVIDFSKKYSNIMISLDSNHTHEHVLKELELYASLVGVGSYLIVFDTIIEYLPRDIYVDRPWNVGNNPKSALDLFLESHPEFVIDTEIDNKLLISVAPGGYVKRIR